MRTLNTLTEIKLLKKNIKSQMQYHEDKIKLQSGEVITGYKSIVYGIIMEQGVLLLLRYFIRKKRKRR